MKIARVICPALLLAAVCLLAAKGVPGPGERVLASVPLEMTRLGAVVPARVNGEGPFRLIVDGSAGVTFLSPKVVGALGDQVEVIRSAEGISDRGAWEKATIRVGTIALGDLILKDVPAVIVDPAAIFGEAETPDGLLGFDLLASHLVTLDYPGKRLRIGSGELPPADGKAVLDYTLESVKGLPGRYPAIRMQVADQIVQARLDLASPGEIMLPTGLADRLPLDTEPGLMARARTPDGDFDILGATLDGTARIGSHDLEKPRLRFSAIYDDPGIGTDLLDQFALTIDQVNGRVRFDRPAGGMDPLQEKAAHVRPVSGEGDDLRTAFNKHGDMVQLVLILSPT